MMSPFDHKQLLATLSTIFILLLTLESALSKVVEIGTQLPDLLREHPTKGWLVKFYAPWCHHCKQLEPVYSNVGERIHRDYNDLIVSRVDCTKYGPVCQQFSVNSYPTIKFLKNSSQVDYKGDRSLESIVSFAERLNGPDIRKVDNCQHLKALAHKHGILILSTEPFTSENEINKAFKSLAAVMKSTYWFYHFGKPCKGFTSLGKLYILKKHLNKPIELQPNAASDQDLSSYFAREIVKESQPIFGSIGNINLDRVLALNKTMMIAFLDEYKPARRWTRASTELFGIMETIARGHSQDGQGLIFAWSSEADLIRQIAAERIPAPNVIFLKPDFSHYVFLRDTNRDKDSNDKLHPSLNREEIESKILSLAKDELDFSGSGILSSIYRKIYGQYMTLLNMYEASPLLCAVLIGFPTLIMIFVIYTTCYLDGPTSGATEQHREEAISDDLQDDDDDDDDDDNDDGCEDEGDSEDGEYAELLTEKNANGHAKQD